MIKKVNFFFMLLLFFLAYTVEAQQMIFVTARPYRDSVKIRWAPRNFEVWQQGIQQGYVIERAKVSKNGKIIYPMEKVQLNRNSIVPSAQEDWKNLVYEDKYAAVACQALYGDRFDVDLGQTDVISIADKVKENEQRFLMTLLCADLSPKVALASGLAFTDTAIDENERYYYTIRISGSDTLRGSLFIGMDEPFELPRPQNLVGNFINAAVSLRWNSSRSFCAYKLQKSFDRLNFLTISNTPTVTLRNTIDNNQYEYGIDSLQNVKTCYYRVIGITAFGEESEPSEIVEVRAKYEIHSVPILRSLNSDDNKRITIEWTFSESDSKFINGFLVERSKSASGNFTDINDGKALLPTSRMHVDEAPERINYYRIVAIDIYNGRLYSQTHLLSLVDSIPPSTPSIQKAEVDQQRITLYWRPNKDPDIDGYRIYKCNALDEEPYQVTSNVLSDSVFIDKFDDRFLNKAVYYSIMAVDVNQNHSSLSPKFRVELPDRIRPMPPVPLNITAADGLQVHWLKSVSDDIKQYDLYRKNTENSEWRRVKIILSLDSVIVYNDISAKPGILYNYTIVAVDSSGNESRPSSAIRGALPHRLSTHQIKWDKPIIQLDQKLVKISWRFEVEQIQSVRVYKSKNGSPFQLYKTYSGATTEMYDEIGIGSQCRYSIGLIFLDGSKSSISEVLTLEL